MREILELNLARAGSFHRPVNVGRFLDPPDSGEKPLNLLTLPDMRFLEAITDSLFPPNTLQGPSGTEYLLHASGARMDRYFPIRARGRPRLGQRYSWRNGTSVPPDRHATGLTSRTRQGRTKWHSRRPLQRVPSQPPSGPYLAKKSPLARAGLGRVDWR
jgi:hypothetical protein